MDDIKFKNIIQVVDFFRGSRKLGSGREGSCYKKDNRCYKLYNHFTRDSIITVSDRMDLLKFRDIIIDNIYFIKCLLSLNDDVIGAGTYYASGISCDGVKLYRRNLDKLIMALGILKRNVYELSSYGIYIDDDYLENIVYDGNVFSLIDTRDYYFSGGEKDKSNGTDDASDIYRKNMSLIMKHLFKSITNVNSSCDDFILEYLIEIDSEYKDYLRDSDLMINPDETIIGIRNVIENSIGRRIDAFSNCRKELLRVRKKK